MLFHRRRERFKFTEKTHSKRGIVTFAVSTLLLVIYIIFLNMAFRGDGSLSMYFGSVGVLALVLVVCCVIFSIQSLREEDSFMLFPRLALIMSVLALLCWGGTYAYGFIA